MKKCSFITCSLFSAFLFAFIFISPVTATDSATEDHSYRVTGRVLAISGTSITVQKGDSNWKIIKDANTHMIPGGNEIKVGDQVCIKYQMIAEQVVIKEIPQK